MWASLLRPKKRRLGADRSPFSSPLTGVDSSPVVAKDSRMQRRRRASAEFPDEADDGGDDAPEIEVDSPSEEDQEEDPEEDENEDGLGEQTPLLPIFSAAHLGTDNSIRLLIKSVLNPDWQFLDSLPVYNITHAIRLLVVPRCETTLTWDQLRSPQVSQFLVRPIQQQTRTSHFSRATVYALMANTLQFFKESYEDPGNSGTSRTRALVCELLAIKLLKEFTTRELIDALSYDFDPLQGLLTPGPTPTAVAPNWDQTAKTARPAQSRATRVSTLEVAIRAQAKRFLAHPLVVRHLEAIWAGKIVFHSAADNLHRPSMVVIPNQTRGYGAANGQQENILQASPDKLQPTKQRAHVEPTPVHLRRSVTLYDPRDASLLKLSRLRVPRYRQFLSTCSLAVLLSLYVAVLARRSLKITGLEVVFWFWSAGFMLDELVGFNEQGFSLYIMSIWNSFDLGILLLLIVFYGMRLLGIILPDTKAHSTANAAYDVLAANAVLLFPRLFSVLDHYRYFSQLLIAFRLMAVDLVAVFVLILISCSGFFVAFTLSFRDASSDKFDPQGVAYALFQMLLGFTPAAWNNWDDYNFLGKIILTLFLFICHFLIVTILITVLTNSFMAIVANANDEHQFVFAVNTISMVKADALFSYVAPTNILAWILTPLRYVVPFRRYVKINRTVIKVTHFPVLFAIYSYERIFLRGAAFEPTDLVENRGRGQQKAAALVFEDPKKAFGLFSPTNRLRAGSVASFHKDRALDEVFRQPYRDSSRQGGRQPSERRKTTHVVDNWMQGMGSDGKASPPVEQDRSILEHLETRRRRMRRSENLRNRALSGHRALTDATRSVASDPEDFLSNPGDRPPRLQHKESDLINMSMDEIIQETDADGDEEDDGLSSDPRRSRPQQQSQVKTSLDHEDYFQQTPTPHKLQILIPSTLPVSGHHPKQPLVNSDNESSKPQPKLRPQTRKPSSSTILFDPVTSPSLPRRSPPIKKQSTASGTATPKTPRRRSPRRSVHPTAIRPRPIFPPRTSFQSAPVVPGILLPDRSRPRNRQTSINFDLNSELGDNFNTQNNMIGAMPSSFATQMAMATGALRIPVARSTDEGNEDSRMMSRLMLARMKTLEEGFQDVIREFRGMRDEGGGGGGGGGGEKGARRKKERGRKKEDEAGAEDGMRSLDEMGKPGDTSDPVKLEVDKGQDVAGPLEHA
jgi:hypothetical protein